MAGPNIQVDDHGNLWDMSSGQPRFVGRAPGTNPITSPFGSPTLPYAGPTAAADLTGKTLSNTKAAADVANIPEEREKLRLANVAAARENMQFVGDPTKHGADYINSIPVDFSNYRNIIPMIAHNQVQVGNVARSNNEAKLLISGAKQFDPNYDPSLAPVRANALQAYTGDGAASQRIQALDRGANALSLLKQYSDQMGGPNVGYSPLNSLIASNQQDTGARLIAAKKFDALLPEAMGQLNTVLAGSTTVSGMKEIKEGLAPNASQDERNAGMEAYAHALVNAAGDLKQGWNSAFGGTAAPPVWISPDNAAFLEKLTDTKAGSLGENDFHGLPGLNPDGTYNPAGSKFTAPPAPPSDQLPGAQNANNFQLSGNSPTGAQIDPVLKAASGHIGQLIAQGASDADVTNFVKGLGVDPANTNLGQVLQFRNSPDFTAWQNANPGKPYPIGAAFYTKQVPLSPARRLFNATAASPGIGGDVIAGATAAGNAMLANQAVRGLGALGGDPQMAQVGMSLLRQNHPLSSLAGDIGGQAALGALLPGVDMTSIPANLAYGAAYGSGDVNNPLGGAVAGGIGGTLGGMFGRGIQSGVGKLARGVQNQAVQYLDSQGIPLTIGQLGHGSNSILGKAVGGIEERAAGFPGFDAVINSARQRGISGFNQAAFNQAGVDNGLTGGAGLSAVNDIKNNAYNFINSTNLPLDAQFAGSQAAVRAGVPTMPAFGNEVGNTLNQIDNISASGAMSGQNWQSALRDVKANRANITGQPFAGDPNSAAVPPTGAASALGQVQDNLFGLADRQGPPGTVDNLNAANQINAQFNTLQSALDNPTAQKAGQLFSPLQLDNASRINTRNFGGRLASLTGQNRPFYDLTQSGLKVMPNLVPDSGTAGRFWLLPLAASAIGGAGGAIGGAMGGEGGEGKDAGLGLGYGAALGLAAAGPYSRTGQAIIQRALLNDRLPAETAIGNYLINNRALGGMFGSGLYRDYQNYITSPLAQ